MSDNKRMRIALLTHQWPGVRMGGIGTAVLQSAGALAAAGHDVHLFTFALPPDVRTYTLAGVTRHEAADLATRVQQRAVAGVAAAAIGAGGEGAYRLALACLLCGELLRVHRDKPFDLVEAPEVEALGLPLMLTPDFAAPVVTHLHCCTALARAANDVSRWSALDGKAPSFRPLPLGESWGEGKPRETTQISDFKSQIPESQRIDALAALEFAAIHLSDAVCAPTEAVARATSSMIPLPDGIRIIPHAFDCRTDTPSLPPADGPILFVGRIERLKGVEMIVDALNEFLSRHPSATFRFIGPDTATGPGDRSMRQFLEARLHGGVRDRVQFLGEVSPVQISHEWQRASFGVMPSLWENFSMSCCEAMAAGRTLIVAAGTGSVELIGDAGIVVPAQSPADLANAMERLWTDRSERDRLSRAAYRRIRERFLPAQIAAQRAEFYRETIRTMQSYGRPEIGQRLATLPGQCSAAILPALAAIIGNLASAADAQPGAATPRTPGTRLLRIMETLSHDRGCPAEVLLYGAGKHTARLLTERHVWESKQHRVVGLIDDHPRFAQTRVYLDLPVQSVDAVKARLLAGGRVPPVVLSTDTYQDQFWAQAASLREAGVPVFRLYA